MISLTRAGLDFQINPHQLKKLKDLFHKNHFICFKDFIEPNFLKEAQKEILKYPLHRFKDKVGQESEINQQGLINAFLFLLNQPNFFLLIEQITDCPKIRSFGGRAYKLDPSGNDLMDWHDDRTQQRLVAMSLNLSPKPYKGGFLELRDKKSKKVLSAVANTGAGDAIIFRVADFLEHRVTPVLGSKPKISLAGWFSAKRGIFKFK